MADALFDVTTVARSKRRRRAPRRYLLRATNTQLASPASGRSTRRRSDDGDEEDDGSNPLPALAADDPLRLLEPLPGAALHRAAAALHRGHAGEGAGGEGHRPAEHLRADHVDDPGPRLRREGRPRAQAHRPRRRGQRPAGRALPRLRRRRLHRRMEDELDEVASRRARSGSPWSRSSTTRWRTRWRPRPRRRRSACEETTRSAPSASAPMVIRWGRRGRFLACTGFPECRGTRSLDGEEQPERRSRPTRSAPSAASPMVIRTRPLREVPGLQPLPGLQGPQAAGHKTRREVPDGRRRPRRAAHASAAAPSTAARTTRSATSRPGASPLATPCPNCGGLLIVDRSKDNRRSARAATGRAKRLQRRRRARDGGRTNAVTRRTHPALSTLMERAARGLRPLPHRGEEPLAVHAPQLPQDLSDFARFLDDEERHRPACRWTGSPSAATWRAEGAADGDGQRQPQGEHDPQLLQLPRARGKLEAQPADRPRRPEARAPPADDPVARTTSPRSSRPRTRRRRGACATARSWS